MDRDEWPLGKDLLASSARPGSGLVQRGTPSEGSPSHCTLDGKMTVGDNGNVPIVHGGIQQGADFLVDGA